MILTGQDNPGSFRVTSGETNLGGKMQFYNLKTRSHVEVPEGEVKKLKMVRPTKSGEQTRYAFTAVHDGQKLFKFVNEATFKASSAPEA
jgi:hypothetical protein